MIRHNKFFSILWVLLITQACVSQQTSRPEVVTDAVKLSIEAIRSEYGVPGLQAALVTGDDILQLVAVGNKQLGGAPIMPSDKMHLGSCGKAMTGYLAGTLVAQGLIEWNTTVIEVFPEFQDSMNPSFKALTLKQLLSHQAPIAAFTTGEEWQLLKQFKAKSPRIRRHQFAEWILEKEPSPFDEAALIAGFRYSNAGYSIAAAMLEKVTDQSWEYLMTDRLFKPLGIDAIYGWPASQDKSQPYGHWPDPNTGQLIPHDPNDDYQIDPILSPSGNISMSVLDYIKFIQKNLQGLNGRDAEHDKAFYDFLHHTNKPQSEYSIGWYAVNQFDDELSTHTGSADTFYCMVLLLVKHNIAVMVLANSATEDTKTATEKIRNLLIKPHLQ